MKKILCVIPFYNRAHLLQEAIESVLQQTYPNIELVLVNDGSTDNYLEVINPYLDRENIHFITYEENRGVAYARNKGLEYLERLNCDYFTIHDSDDISDITRFEKIIKKFDQNTLGISTTYLKTNINNEPLIFNGQYDIKSSEGIAFYSKQTFDILGYFHNYPAGEDTDYWWRLQKYVEINKKYNIKEDNEILYYARTHENNTSSNYKQSYPAIWGQIRNDVYEMSKTNNFYREKFD
jgi:glycosyltransferase involved in cell wall biosynthesis